MTDHSSTPARRPWPAISRRAALRTAGVAAGAGAVAALMPGVASATTSKPMAAPVRAAADPVIPAPVSVPLQLVPSDAGFNYSALTALGMAGYGLTEVGEVLTTIASINAAAGTAPVYPNYAQAYVDTFTATADLLASRSTTALKSHHRQTGADLSLRAAQYYAQALFYVLATDRPGTEAALFGKCSSAWQTFLGNTPVHVSPLPVHYGGTTMPAWILSPDGSGRPRPTIILTNGSDGMSADLWSWGAAAALERGWNAVIYEGPGQGAMLMQKKIPFTSRWENVVTPIVDALCRRRDVDRRRIVLTGLSMGGNLVARAASFEHRLAAVVCEPGVATPWTGFPQGIQNLVTTDKTTTNQNWAKVNASDLPASVKFLLAKRFEPFSAEALNAGRAGNLMTDLWTPAQTLINMNVTNTVSRITCPTLVLDYEGEQFYPGQPTTLYNALSPRIDKSYVLMTAADGAQLHCSPMAPQHHNEVIFDWLDSHLKAR